MSAAAPAAPALGRKVPCGHAKCKTKKPRCDMFQCSRCKDAVFCSKECQVAAWKKHKKTCKPAARAEAQAQQRALTTADLVDEKTEAQKATLANIRKLQEDDDWGGLASYTQDMLNLVADTEALSPMCIMTLLGVLGTIFRKQGNYAESLRQHTKEFELACQERMLEMQVYACGNLASCHAWSEDYKKALEMHEKHRTLTLEPQDTHSDDKKGHAKLSVYLGRVFDMKGQDKLAKDMYRVSMGLFLELEDHAGVATVNGAMGEMLMKQGMYEEAMHCFSSDKELCEKIGHHHDALNAKINLANCVFYRGDYDVAKQMFDDFEEACIKYGDKKMLFGILGSKALCHQAKGRFDEAMALYRRQIEWCGAKTLDFDRNMTELYARGNLGICLCSTMEYEQGIRHFYEGHALACTLDLKGQISLTRFNIAVAEGLWARRGRFSSECDREAKVEGAIKKLVDMYNVGFRHASLHMAYLALALDREAEAVLHMHMYMDAIVVDSLANCGSCKKNFQSGSQQELKKKHLCAGCKVVRFCNKQCQTIASKRVTAGGSIFTERHKDICTLLGEWRNAGVGADARTGLRGKILTFLRNMESNH